ncbi:MAG TPA: methyltransferase domain-containing protein [Acidimicrobiia bacterium]|jgi:SAM-dependent methyltransferase
MAPPELNDEILTHYAEEVDEGTRLGRGLNELELIRTRDVLRAQLGDAPARILDIGGATGVHARWLTDDGHRVHVVDPVPRHVEAVLALRDERPGITAELGDARALAATDSSYDVVLVFGPMYHLTERDERVLALREAARVVVPGGPVFVAAISRHASLLSGLAHEFLFDPDFRAIVERDLRDGQHRNPQRRPEWFTTAYFHRAEDLVDEIAAAGLEPLDVIGLEGPAAWLPHLESRWRDPEGREAILFSARTASSEPAFSPHLLAVSRRPR